MNAFLRTAVTVVAVLSAIAAHGRAAAAAKIPLDYRAYNGWNTIAGTVLSDDGRYAAYALMPQDGDPTLVLHDFQTGNDVKEPRGTKPAFTPDGKYLVYVVRAPNGDIHKAMRDHKKPAEMPKSGLGILDIATGAVVTVERVKDFKLPKDAGHDTLAYALESPLPSPSPSSSIAASPSPGPTVRPSTNALPSASATPDDLHAKDDSSRFVIRDLASGTELPETDVTSYAVSHDGAFVAFATETKDGKKDGVAVRALAGTSSRIEVAHATGHYKNLTFAPKDEIFAYVSDSATFARPAPSYALFQCALVAGASGHAPGETLATVADESTNGLQSPSGALRDSAPSENGTLRFSKDGKRLFFGVAPLPTPVPTMTPDPVKVDIWNWQDGTLQSEQRKEADDDRKYAYEAVVRTDGTHAYRLATKTMRKVDDNENADVGLGIDDQRHHKEQSWDTEYDDLYALSFDTGAARLLISRQNPAYELSPGGGYVVAYDSGKRAWFSVSTRSGRRVDLTSKLHVAFYDVLDDHPAPPRPYGTTGWIDGDRFVLIRDRYDIWAIDPERGVAHLLTGGIGRKRHIVFTAKQLDPDADSFDSAKPIVLEAKNDDTKDSGVWRVAASGPGSNVPHQIVMLPKAVTVVAKARLSDRLAVFEQTFSEMRNLWSSPTLDVAFARFSDANPQRANYLWGNEQLVSYRSTWGVPLHGVLYTPDDFDAHKRYPMLVYFYERFSDDYHAMPFTVPAPNTSPTLVRYVSNGYVVFVPDVAYRTGHPGESAYGCIMPAIDSVMKRGFVDASRIGIAGHSWAAYQIAYLLTRTNRFRAAEAGAAVANMTSAYGGIRLESGVVREAQYERGQSRIGATPWDRPDLYLENSALFHVRNVNTPYLTIANDLDGAVPQLQGIEFFTALRRLGKEAYLFSFDGEDHNLRGREQQKYWTVHMDEFFDHFLMGKKTPDWMAHGVDFLHRGLRNVDRDEYGEAF